jgi:hypothetical protein
MVAGAVHEIVETGAFSPENNNEVAGEIELVVCSAAALVETDDPEVAALEILKSADQVNDSGDA